MALYPPRTAGTDASVRGNLLYRRDGGLGEVLHRPMVFQRPLLEGAGKIGGQTRWSQLRANLPAYILGRTSEALRLLAVQSGLLFLSFPIASFRLSYQVFVLWIALSFDPFGVFWDENRFYKLVQFVQKDI